MSNTGGTALINGASSLSIQAAALTNAGQIGSTGGSLTLTIGGDITNSGRIAAGDAGTVRLGGKLSNTGTLYMAQTLTLANLTGGRIGALSNTGGAALINGVGGLSIQAATLSNAGQIGSTSGILTLTIGGDITNSGRIAAGGAGTVRLGGKLSNSGTLYTAQTLTLANLTGGRIGALSNTGGTALTQRRRRFKHSGNGAQQCRADRFHERQSDINHQWRHYQQRPYRGGGRGHGQAGGQAEQ